MNEVVSMNDREFRFGDYLIRTRIENDKPWFVAQDVCKALGLKYVNSALKRVYDADLRSIQYSSGGQIREFSCVSKEGFNDLVLESRSPNARLIRRWLTHEVMPSIEKTGQYSIQRNVTERKPTTVETIRELLALAEQAERIANEVYETKKEVKVNTKEIVRVDEKVDRFGSRLDNYLSHRHELGSRMPEGTLTRKQITERFFPGLSEDNVGTFLRLCRHPYREYRLEVDPGAPELVQRSYLEEGLAERVDQLFNHITFVKETPKNFQFASPQLGAIRFNKLRVSSEIRKRIEANRKLVTTAQSDIFSEIDQ